ncbi:hypothetical protein SKAU_G00319800 [Synaphobranchus kaupii]|uniref:Uncharacterized protein n=1 Tax=Synaphobranchus kaupii TaxID=118154 RepID=A0A9Q1ENL2_SYNKA|nr:hypothetical protein SKAU_G00319800 [Synaphobranchus kaupii]
MRREDLQEVLAVLCNAVHHTIAGGKWWPRGTQMAGWCFLALTDNGKLLQMGTGEGKSVVVAMFAALRALRGEKVDVVSSSSVLCQRDAEECADFFSYFGLTVDTNTNKTKNTDRKKCYQKDIVYGTVETYAADHLRQIFEMKDVRPVRRYDCIIIDEVDLMLLDQGIQVTYLSSPMVSMQHLNIILTMIWGHVYQYGFLTTGYQTFIIISTDHLQECYRTVSSLEEAKNIRDSLAVEKIQDMQNDIDEMKLREDLFSEYCKTLQEIYNSTDEDEQKAIVPIMNEFWGIWLLTKTEEINQLKRTELEDSLRADLALAKQQSESQSSPSSSIYHYIKFGNVALKDNNWDLSIKLFQKAMNQDASWAAIAFYNHAYCMVMQQTGDYLTKAKDDLKKAQDSLKYFSEECMAGLSFIKMSSPKSAEDKTSSLEKQFTNKCNMLGFLDKNMSDAIKKLDEIKGKGRDAHAKKAPVFTLVSESEQELQMEAFNLYDRGLHYIFTVEEEPRFPWEALVVFLLGVAQIVGGALLTAFTFGALAQVEDKDGKLTKMQEMNPSTDDASQTVTLIYRPKSDQHPEGHYDVQINNKIVSVEKGDVYNAMAHGMKPDASKEDIASAADNLRTKEAEALEKKPTHFESFIQRDAWIKEVMKGSWKIAEEVEKKNKILNAIKKKSEEVTDQSQGTTQIINGVKQPPKHIISASENFTTESKLSKAMFEVAADSSDHAQCKLPVVYALYERNNKFPTAESPELKRLLAETISKDDVEGTFKLTIIGAMPTFMLERKHFLNEDMSQTRLDTFEHSFPERAKELVNTWFKLLESKTDLMKPETKQTLENWINGKGYLDPNDSYRKQITSSM